MSITSAEPIMATCPHCGAVADVQVWTLIDTQERPDLLDALIGEELNRAACPKCGAVNLVSGPLLLHDPTARRVYFAVPSASAEHQWREQAQRLLYTLVGALPEEARLPYLGDVQVEHELEGVRRALLRRGRRAARARVADSRQADARSTIDTPQTSAPAASAPSDSPLFDWIQALLAADTPHEFRATVAEHPALLEDSTDALISALAAQAIGAGEPDVAQALQRTRLTLAGLREAQALDQAAEVAQIPPQPAVLPLQVTPESEQAEAILGEEAYQAFLAAESPDGLLEAARDHPALLEPWVDTMLAARVDAALEEGNERLATLVDERREALGELRAALTTEQSLYRAIEALISAEGEGPIAAVIAEYPALLTEVAQQTLLDLAAGARAHGDERRAIAAIECRAMLREVRHGFDMT